jgi:hypothetical protein
MGDYNQLYSELEGHLPDNLKKYLREHYKDPVQPDIPDLYFNFLYYFFLDDKIPRELNIGTLTSHPEFQLLLKNFTSNIDRFQDEKFSKEYFLHYDERELTKEWATNGFELLRDKIVPGVISQELFDKLSEFLLTQKVSEIPLKALIYEVYAMKYYEFL